MPLDGAALFSGLSVSSAVAGFGFCVSGVAVFSLCRLTVRCCFPACLFRAWLPVLAFLFRVSRRFHCAGCWFGGVSGSRYCGVFPRSVPVCGHALFGSSLVLALYRFRLSQFGIVPFFGFGFRRFGFGSLPVSSFSVRGLSVCSVISGGLLSVVIAIIPV